MTITLDENKWAAHMLATCSLGSNSFETLRRVARYFLDAGLSVKDARSRIDIFLLQCDHNISLGKYADLADKALALAEKTPAIAISNISISSSELEKISALSGRQLQRLAFTLLCLSKYHMLINPNCDNWISLKDSEIFASANIKTSIKRQCLLYQQLEQAGLVRFSRKVNSLSMQILFSDDSDAFILVSDFRNLGNQYLMYLGEHFFPCHGCGLVVKYKKGSSSHMQKYCQKCASDKKSGRRNALENRLLDFVI